MNTSTHNATVAIVVQVFHQGGYGFAVTDDGREIYFHQHAVGSRLFDELRTGDRVDVEIAPPLGDEQQAHAIKMCRHGSPATIAH
jgi:cold shock CspA family protein